METFKIIVDLIGKIIWPGITLAIVLIFRKQIKNKFTAITEISGSGISVKMITEIQKKVKAEVAEVAEEIEERIVEEKIAEEKVKEKEANIPKENLESKNTEIENSTLLAFACGKSLKSNLKYNIYFDPATRRHNTKFKYIGLYANMKIVAIGQLKKVVYCDYKDGELIGTNGDKLIGLTEDESSRIKGIIDSLEEWDLYVGLKFYLVDEFYETKFERESPSPLRAKKYIWLDDIDGFKEGMTAKELAKLLNNKSW